MAEEEEEEEEYIQVSAKQEKEIAKWFLLHSPVCETQFVAKDLRSVLNDERASNEAAHEAFSLYNKSHMVCLEFPHKTGDVLVTNYDEVNKNEYIDPRTAQVAIVNHFKQVCTMGRPASDEELPSPHIEEFRW